MNRRELAFLVSVLLALAAFLWLTPTDEPAGADADEALVDWDRTVDDPARRLRITWAGIPVHPSSKKDTWVEQHLEKQFNVDLDPVFLDWNSYRQRRPMMFAAGEVPNVNWDGNPLVLRRNIHHGFVLEIPYRLILEHAPTYVRHLNRYGAKAWLYARYRGRNYGIPTFSMINTHAHSTFWRKDWLDRVGIEKTPDNLEELHEALWKFRHEDPDGNGVKDTYGICPPTNWHAFFVDIFNAFGILPQDFQLRDGRVVWGGIQPEAKEVLGLLRTWYEEELIDPDFAIGSATGTNMRRKFINGKLGYMNRGSYFTALDASNPSSLLGMMRGLDPDVELVAARPIRGVDGVRRDRVWGGAAHVIWFGKSVAAQPEKVIRVLRMFERLAADRDLFLESRLGVKGTHWDTAPGRGAFLLPPYDRRGEDMRNLISVQHLESCTSFYSCFSAPPEVIDPLLPEGVAAFRATYNRPEWALSNAIGKSDVVPSAGLYVESLRQFQTVAFVEIIRGDKPLRYFDTFVDEWRKRGGDTITREANEVFADMENIYRTVGKRPPGAGDEA